MTLVLVNCVTQFLHDEVQSLFHQLHIGQGG